MKKILLLLLAHLYLLATPTSLTITKGWNLVGFSESIDIASFVSRHDDITALLEFDDNSQWKTYNKSNVESGTPLLSKTNTGFWLFARNNATISLATSGEVAFDVSTYKNFLKSDDFAENEDEFLTLRVEGAFLFMKGTINEDSLDEYTEVLEDNPQVRAIIMTDVPGSIDDHINLKLAKLIYDKKLITYLPAKGLIASGGVDFFYAGEQRYLEEGARVGVHSWADDEGTEGKLIPRDDPQHAEYLDYFRYINQTEDFYWFTLETAAEDLHYMSTEEMRTHKLFTTFIEK